MIRHCNGTDPNLRTEDGTTGNCGAIFDDVNHWATCPHDAFPINPALQALINGKLDAAVEAVDAKFFDEATHITGVPNDIGGARVLAGPPRAHRDGSCGPECYVAPSAALGGDTIPIVPGEPAATDPEGAEAGSDTERIAAATARYMAAAHAMQSGVAQLLYFNDTDAQPKHVRVGINLSKVTEGVLVKVLIDMGIITHAEWVEALAQGVEDEVRRYEADLTEMMGARVRLL